MSTIYIASKFDREILDTVDMSGYDEYTVAGTSTIIIYPTQQEIVKLDNLDIFRYFKTRSLKDDALNNSEKLDLYIEKLEEHLRYHKRIMRSG